MAGHCREGDKCSFSHDLKKFGKSIGGNKYTKSDDNKSTDSRAKSRERGRSRSNSRSKKKPHGTPKGTPKGTPRGTHGKKKKTQAAGAVAEIESDESASNKGASSPEESDEGENSESDSASDLTSSEYVHKYCII